MARQPVTLNVKTGNLFGVFSGKWECENGLFTIYLELFENLLSKPCKIFEWLYQYHLDHRRCALSSCLAVSDSFVMVFGLLLKRMVPALSILT